MVAYFKQCHPFNALWCFPENFSHLLVQIQIYGQKHAADLIWLASFHL